MARKIQIGVPETAAPEAAQPKGPKPKGRERFGMVPAMNVAFTNALQEIDPDLIDTQGLVDRLDDASLTADDEALKASIAEFGQQVPCLVRKHPEERGRFQIVYGRRRLRACQALGIKVKAIVRDLDDQQLVIAQGQENSSRRDLSFYEKCRFAAEIEGAGYDRKTIADALNTSLPTVSNFLTIAQVIPAEIGYAIGPAPGIGRERWVAFRKKYEAAENAAERTMQAIRAAELDHAEEGQGKSLSDGKFLAALTALTKPAARPAPELSADNSLGEVQDTRSEVRIIIRKQGSEGFARWVQAHAPDLIQELHARYQQESGAEE